MTSNKTTMSRFLGEALAEGELEAHEVAAMKSLLEPAALPADDDGLQALLTAVESPHHRYAPFARRVANLIALPEAQAAQMLSSPQWVKSPLPGIQYMDLPRGVEQDPELSSTLVRFAPGARYPRHSHTKPEQVLILEGGYRDDQGQRFGAGDLHEMVPGSEHALKIDDEGPCIAVVVSDKKLHFSSWILRGLSKIFAG